MAAQYAKGTRTGAILRFRCYRARAAEMRRRGYQGSAPMAMQIMYNSPLQTRAHHAILCFSQLELGRPIAPSVLQPQHRHKSAARISYHGLQTDSSAT